MITLGVIVALSILASLAAFIAFWRDKRAAGAGKRRTPEQTLLVLCALGGWPGATLAMRRFRHKTRKKGFIAGVVFGGIVHVGVSALILWSMAGWE